MLSGGTLTRTSAAGTPTPIRVPVDNDGTIDVGAGTLNAGGTFTNYNQLNDRLTGGAYVVRNGSTFQFAGADVKQNFAEITLDGAGSGFSDGPPWTAFATSTPSTPRASWRSATGATSPAPAPSPTTG